MSCLCKQLRIQSNSTIASQIGRAFDLVPDTLKLIHKYDPTAILSVAFVLAVLLCCGPGESYLMRKCENVLRVAVLSLSWARAPHRSGRKSCNCDSCPIPCHVVVSCEQAAATTALHRQYQRDEAVSWVKWCCKDVPAHAWELMKLFAASCCHIRQTRPARPHHE